MQLKSESEINDRLELGSKNAYYLINFKYLQNSHETNLFSKKKFGKVKISLNPITL